MHLHTLRRGALAVAVTGAIASAPAAASCGSAVCLINTNFEIQSPGAEAGQGRVDLHFEYIKQDRLRSGSHTISAADDTADTLELETINRNFVATLDYVFSERWGVTATLPVVDRNHSHIDDPTGEAAFESWAFTRAGDARVVGRYMWQGGDFEAGGLQFGLKLPTGTYRVTNGEGVQAERSLQPGTGSTDLVVGAYYSRVDASTGVSVFAQATFQGAVATRDGYRPGGQFGLTGSVTWPLSDATALQLQLNALFKSRDSGVNAESDLSGGRYLFASPGVSYALTRDTTIYAYAQLPLYQYVYGTQLTTDWAAVGGVSVRF